MAFAHPWLLLLLLLLPILAWLKGRRGRPPAFVYSSVQLVRSVLNVTRSHSGGFLAALRWLALALFIVALAQPRLIKSETKVRASGIDIAVALDLSGSMAAEDYDFVPDKGGINRLEMAKAVLKKFVEKRPNDRIGLVAFGSQAYIAAPMTLDHDFLQQNLERLELNSIDGSQTAIGSGLSTAINRLRELKSKSKIVILMTDGVNNAGKIAPLSAAEAGKSLSVKVYTIGVGKRGTAPMPQMTPFGKRYVSVPVEIDEDTLQKIAQMTGGKYYRADNAENFQKIYAEIDKLEKSEAEVKKYTQFTELFPWLVAPGFGLVLIELVLKNTILRRLP